MISINRYLNQDVFRNNEKVLNSLRKQIDIKPISLAIFEAKVISTREFDNNYRKLLDYSYQAGGVVMNELFRCGYNAWIFELGPFLTHARLEKINNYSPFGNLRKSELFNVANFQKRYEFPGGIKCAGLFEVNRDDFYKAYAYIQSNSYSVILLSKRDDILTEENLDKIFKNSAFENNIITFGSLDFVTLCLEICPQGDLIVNVGGAYDDLFRSFIFYFCLNVLITT